MAVSIESLSETHRLDQLPAFPGVLLALLRSCQQPDPSNGEVEALVGQDSGLSVRVLSVASSPVFARGDAPRDLSEAVRLLGLRTVHTIGVTTGVHQFFYQLDGHQLPWLRTFWRHSVGAATAAKRLAEETGQARAEEAYLAGLLHDVGQPLLAVLYRDSMQRIMEESLAHGRDARTLEKQQLGIGHDELGAAMVDRWHLPGFLADAIRFHHEPVEALADAHPLVRITHVANLLAHSGTEPDAEALHAAGQLLDLGRSVASRLHRQAVADRDELVEALDGDDAVAAIGRNGPPLHPLADQVRNQALLGSIHAHLRLEADSQPVDNIARGLALLFGLDQIACFQLQNGGEALIGAIAGRAAPDLTGLRVPLDAGRSLLARSLLENRPVHTLDPDESAALTVVDRQVASRLVGDGILCLPLRYRGEAQGVLVLGVRHTQTSALLDQSELLLAFAGEAAALVHQARHAEAQRRQQELETRAVREQDTRHVRQQLGDPLTIIRNYLHVLEKQVEAEHPAHDSLMTVLEEVERVTELLRTLDVKTADAAGDREPNVNQLVRELARVAREAQLVPEALQMDLALDDRLDGERVPAAVLRPLLLSILRLHGDRGGSSEVRILTAAGVQFGGKVYNEVLLESSGCVLEWTTFEQDGRFSAARRVFGEQGGVVAGAQVPRRGYRVQILWPAGS